MGRSVRRAAVKPKYFDIQILDFMEENRNFFRELASPKSSIMRKFMVDHSFMKPFFTVLRAELENALNTKQQLNGFLTALQKLHIYAAPRRLITFSSQGPSVEQILAKNHTALDILGHAMDTLKLVADEFKEYQQLPPGDEAVGDLLDKFEAQTFEQFEQTSAQAIQDIASSHEKLVSQRKSR